MTLAFKEHTKPFARDIDAENSGGHRGDRLFTVRATPQYQFSAVSVTSGVMHLSMSRGEAIALARALVDAVKEVA